MRLGVGLVGVGLGLGGWRWQEGVIGQRGGFGGRDAAGSVRACADVRGKGV